MVNTRNLAGGVMIGKTAYMYQLKNGRFRRFKGHVTLYSRGRCVFVKDGDTYLYTVANGQDEPYWNTLWMSERDDEKARMLLKAAIEQKIADYESRIQRERDLLKILEESSLEG